MHINTSLSVMIGNGVKQFVDAFPYGIIAVALDADPEVGAEFIGIH